ncbi:NAD(P)-dependent dehydrogenase (short-subunit alcohol dehydrogenase family) [Neolewinella xylanilytica]|uniref:NAD(P)-dependent dehydrogenase (Short-subunit alcohol dehydrogenase family) n=1 Tax=Neolewinella xylanilytica TaxID=1514080 RepID=A0A2S6IBJ6_9BACT|nr:SDR family oxidoreductase [Neolewinella xylanilytica]PPK88868.1 NAD(P)-dependent dehydrogenase (short-subunit alcohol dehydrogenase family) [Neolewinella xylanilytica]
MRFSLQNKRAIVTGGSSGIGAAITQALGEQGADVHVLDLRGEGNRFHACDVSDQDAVRSCITAIAGGGPIDILVNNAGVGFVGNLENTTEADLDRLFAINIKGVYNCALACVPHMKEKGGVILNMASVAATVAVADRFAYSMTKGAVLTMTYSIAKDYLQYGIRCNSISPARVHTPFVDAYLTKNYPGREKEMFEQLSKTQPIGRMGEPREVADLAAYLCSDEAAFLTGTDFPIDGGFIKLNG